MAQTPLQKIKRFRNRLWPLPLDYDDLTTAGQRQARVNACRQWLLPIDKIGRIEKAEAKVGSVRFFDYYYLYPDETSDFNPMFYDDAPFPTPEFHDDMTRSAAVDPLFVAICPRGSAKSTRCKKETCLEMVSRPGWSTIYATSTHANAIGFGQGCKEQLYDNARIIDDWAPEYEGALKPKRGEKPTATQFFYLNNGSWLRTMSAGSRGRGQRPRKYKLDDPEYDESGSTSMALLRSYMERLLFKVVLPMVTRPGTGAEWRATFVTKQHYAYLAMQVDADGNAVDPRFDRWARMFVDAIVIDNQGNPASCWPHLWPLTVASKRELAAKTHNPRYLECKSLEEMEREMGPSVFRAEMRGQPGDSKDAFFGALNKEKHGYWFENEDAALANAPRRSEATICWDRGGTIQKLPLPVFLNHSRVFVVGDTSFTSGAASDHKGLVMMALTAENELFILEPWAVRGREELLVEETLKMANKWQAGSIHPEVVQKGFSYYLSLAAQLKTRAASLSGYAHLPRLEALKPPSNMSKEGKISGLLYRFEHGLIKFPYDLRTEMPRRTRYWSLLLDQVEGFNPDVKDGGLQSDDLLDCVASSNLIIKGKHSNRPQGEKIVKSPTEQLLEGEVLDESGLPLALSIDITQLSGETLHAILAARKGTPDPEGTCV